MKAKMFKIAAIMLVLAGWMNSCGESNASKTMNEDMFLEHLKSATYVDTPKGHLPEWLIVKINTIEARSSSISSVQIYKGEWNNQTVYFIMDIYSSCFCDFYAEDSERIDNLSDLRATSKNWVLIYKYGELL